LYVQDYDPTLEQDCGSLPFDYVMTIQRGATNYWELQVNLETGFPGEPRNPNDYLGLYDMKSIRSKRVDQEMMQFQTEETRTEGNCMERERERERERDR